MMVFTHVTHRFVANITIYCQTRKKIVFLYPSNIRTALHMPVYPLLLTKIGFLPVTIWDLLDVLIVGFLIFQLYKLLRGTIAYAIFAGLLLLYIVWWLVARLKMDLLTAILNQFVNVGVIILVIIFQQEIRRILLYVGNTAFKRQARLLGTMLDSNFPLIRQHERQINAIVDAMMTMSKKKTGALIVLAGNVKLDGVASHGVTLDAQISEALLLSIFQRESPIHDGAVLIGNGKIISAACILPVSDNPDLPKSAGLRHRAAVGISERASVAAFVVSEETGGIAMAWEGKLKRKINEENLRNLLTTHYA
jgi:diadenylate cyclase